MISTFRFDNPDEYMYGTPHAEFARLRGDSPFAWHASGPGPGAGFWLATRHADVVSISTNVRLFASSAAILTDPLPKQFWPLCPSLAMLADNLMTFEPHRHRIFRVIANPLFSPSRIGGMEDEIRATCAAVIDSVAGRAQFDFAADVALPIPVEIVLGKLLGVPAEDRVSLSRRVLALNAIDDPVYLPRRSSFHQASEEIFAYGLALLSRLHAAPVQTLLGELVHNAAAEGFSMEELTCAYWLPFVAGGFDTTASTIAGGVYAFMQFPAELNRLREDPTAIPAAVEEMLRWVSPVNYFRRTATADTEFHGNHILEGQKILLCYPSANRDEAVFTNPQEFDIKRTPNRHVTFGNGPHHCIGARFATLMLRVFLEEFLRRMPPLEMDGEVIHTRSFWMNRIRCMPVRNTRALAAATLAR